MYNAMLCKTLIKKRYNDLNCHSQQINTSSKSTIETVEKVMKYVQS